MELLGFLASLLFLLRHLGDVVIAEMRSHLEVFVFLFSRLETQAILTKVVIDTLESFLMSWAPAVGAPIS